MLNGIKAYMQTMKMAQNPTQALEQICQQNPQVQNVVDLCRGRDPKEVFMEQCKKQGIDPQQIIDMLM
jgi:hypothetical protein